MTPHTDTTTPAAPPVDTGPIGVPPGGGSWTWDAVHQAWASADAPAPAPALQPTAQE